MFNYFQQPDFLPAQQVKTAAGRASIDKLRMAPDSSVLIMDTTAPIVWLCVSDGLGNVTSEPYDISPHKEEQPQSDLEKRLAAIEEQLMEVLNGKSNDGSSHVETVRPRKTGVRNDAESGLDA